MQATAAVYTIGQNVGVSSTPEAGDTASLQAPTVGHGVAITKAIGLNSSWQPIASGWLASISAGWGFTSDNDTQALASEAAAQGFSLQSAVSQSLSVGLRWVEAFVKRNTFGMAVAQATVITTSKVSGSVPNDAGDA